PEIHLLSQPYRHSFRADVIDHRLVNRKPRIWIDDLIALFGERQDSEKNNWLTARNNDHFLGCNVYAPRFAYVLRYDLAQFHQSCRRPVMCETSVQRITSGVYDVARRVQIGLPDLKMNDAAALRFKRFRFYQHFKRRLSPEPRHAFGEAKFRLRGLVHNSESSSSRRFSQLSTINTQTLACSLTRIATGTPRPRYGTSPSDWRTFATSQPRVQFGVLKRWLPFVILVLVLLVAVLAVHVDWTWKRKLSPRGGRYFFHRVELAVPSFHQGEENWRDDPLGGIEANGTLGGEGCAVAAAAMVFKFYGIEVDPQQLNWFLTSADGYTENGWIY